MSASFLSPIRISPSRPYQPKPQDPRIPQGVSDLCDPFLYDTPDKNNKTEIASVLSFNGTLLSTLDMSKTDSSEEIYELKSRNRSLRDKIPENLVAYVDVVLKPDDTLHSLALRYGCKVSELKRINKLIRDQDLYALKKIKIPVVRYGCVQEQIEKDETDIASAYISANAAVRRFVDDASDYDDDHYQANDRTCLLERQPSVAVSTQGQQAIEYLQNVDRDIKNILSSTMPQQLPTDDFVTRPPINRQTSITIRWKPLLSLIASLLIIPLIIFLFLFLNHTIGNVNF